MARQALHPAPTSPADPSAPPADPDRPPLKPHLDSRTKACSNTQ